MKPEWCPQDVWDEAHGVAVQVLAEYGEQIKTMRPLIARALLEAHQRGRREGLEEGAKLLDEGYDREVGKFYRKDRLPSKNDECPHGRYIYEDCESCGAAAIRAKADEVQP